MSSRLMMLILGSCRRRAKTAGELRDVLGSPPPDTPLLRCGDSLDDRLLAAARPDIVYEDGIPWFVEFNIDGAVGGTLHADLLATRFLSIFDADRRTYEMSAPASSVDARFAEIRASLGDGARVAIPVFLNGAAPGLEDPRAFLSWLGPMCESGRRAGLDPVACLMEQLATDESRNLRLDGRRVDAVLRLFLSLDQPASPGTAALARAVQAGTVAMHTPETTWLLSDKTTLAWLWEDIGLLAPEDQRLIRRHMPLTTVFPAQGTPVSDQVRAAQGRRAHLVLKPAAGYGGTGVVLGPAVSGERWQVALLEAASAGRYVLQQHVSSERVPIPFVNHDTGETRWADVPFVVGPFLFGDRPSGVLVRHSVPDSGPVVNAHDGAVLSTALLTRPPC
jgi:hypothetical protein